MRHEVPQFIDIEDKLFGPFTFFQGLYLLGGFFGGFIIFYLLDWIFPGLPTILKVTAGVPLFAFGVALAFLKINKRSFLKYLEAIFYFLLNPKRYIWKKKEKKKKEIDLDNDFRLPGDNIEEKSYMIQNEDYKIKNKRSRIKDLANSLDMEVD